MKGGINMKIAILIILITFFLTQTVLSTIIRVPQDQPSIQAGINTAVDGDIVLVSDSTYYENINYKGKKVTVASYYLIDNDTSHISATIIDGSQPANPDSGSVVTFVSGEDTNSVLCGFTIRRGSGTYTTLWNSVDGGGIFCWDSGCKIVNNIIIDNSAVGAQYAGGGGLAALPIPCLGYVILKDNIISNNIASASSHFANGGGLKIYGGGEIRDNLIAHNICYSNNNFATGGGLDCYTDDLQNPPYITVINNEFIDNSVVSDHHHTVPQAQGGGLRIRGYDALIQGNIFKHNSATSFGPAAGGAIRVTYASLYPVIDNNIINNNSTSGWGGGLSIDQSNPILQNNIIADNTANRGGGISLIYGDSSVILNNTIINNEADTIGGGLASHDSDFLLENTIIWGNHAPLDSQINYYGGNVVVNYCDVQDVVWPGLENISEDPQLLDTVLPSGDTLFCCLGTTSPCIDMGNPDPAYNDWEDPNNPGYALWPAMGTVRNDMGVYGGPFKMYTNVNILNTRMKIPESISLFQNYPNPFNPTTRISWQLAASGSVKLTIYNLLGQRVVVLINERQPAGDHSIEFNGLGLASGVYLYRLEAGNQVKTRKMVLMK
jgi:hypothetical protein